MGVDTPPPPVPGARLLGTSEYDGAQGIAVDSSGNIYITGWTLGNLDGNPNAGVNDTFLTKCDSSGIKQWTRLLGGGSNDDLAFGIAVDGSGNTYITGRTRGDLDGNISTGWWEIFLTKYDSSGNRQWTRLLGTAESDDGAHSIAVDGRGNVYIAGVTAGYYWLDGIPNGGGGDAFLAKYDSSGDIQWTKLLGSSGTDQATGVAVDGSGNIYITGSTSGYLGGWIPNAGGADAFLAKFDSSGVKQWAILLGTSGDDHARGIAVDSSGNVYIAGYTGGDLGGNPNAGYHDAFLAKYEPEWGFIQWTRLLGSSGTDWANGVAVDGSGNVYMTGHTSGNLEGNINAGGYYDAFLAKYDSSGNKQWTRLLGSPGDDQANGVAVDGSGNIFMAGFTSGDLDGNPNAGDYDIFWVQYSPDGVKQ